MKIALCRVPLDHAEVINAHEDVTQPYTLPDKSIINIPTKACISCPDQIFSPVQEKDILPETSIQDALKKSLLGSYIGSRNDLRENIVLSGGTSLL